MCMPLGRRLQLLIDEPRYRRVAARARQRNMSVSAVIRDAIDAAIPADVAKKRAALEEVLAAEPVPMPDVEDLKAELDEIRSGQP